MKDKISNPFKRKVQEIIFEADTFYGKLFDIVLLITILLSLVAVMLESIESIHDQYGDILRKFEWIVSILFTIEYLLRIYSTGKPLKYIFSFYGIIDFISFMPTYFMPLFSNSQYFTVVRTFRLLRVFRILKLARYIHGSKVLLIVLRKSTGKIVVFLTAVLTLVILMGTAMYLVEGQENGFTSIPQSIYWAIVTLTTVGYGDIVPCTILGKCLAAFIMILGYGIIAVPSGIFAAEFSKKNENNVSTQSCPDCTEEGHELNAKFCKKCGTELNP
ncbi:MAG: ion transporter [Flavobacteriales bacterium]|nr:ion transporter [Flavobacteriales bacterium]